MNRIATICILNFAIVVSSCGRAAAQGGAPPAAAVDLRPKFTPGQILRYHMELATTTTGETAGVVQDPQGPSKLIVTWDATVRIDILPPSAPSISASSSVAPLSPAAGAAAPGALRLRMTYEKSAATVQSDSYDPAADSVRDQYQRLEGRAVEFALDSRGKVIDVSGVGDVVASPEAARYAQAWAEQFSAGLGAPGAIVAPGQHWSADEPATGIPLPNMTWHTDSTYLRNDPCSEAATAAPPSAVTPSPAGGTAKAAEAGSPETCAVILNQLSLVPPKSARKSAKSGALAPLATGSWIGTGESLIYISLRTGWVVNVEQSGDEKMDVTITSQRLDSIRYDGSVHSHIDLTLLPQ